MEMHQILNSDKLFAKVRGTVENDLLKEVKEVTWCCVPCGESSINEGNYDSCGYVYIEYLKQCGGCKRPWHCNKCGIFLKNPLSEEGKDWLRNKLKRMYSRPKLNPRYQKYRDFYLKSK